MLIEYEPGQLLLVKFRYGPGESFNVIVVQFFLESQRMIAIVNDRMLNLICSTENFRGGLTRGHVVKGHSSRIKHLLSTNVLDFQDEMIVSSC